MLDRHRTPIELSGREKHRVSGQQEATSESGSRASDSIQQKIKQPNRNSANYQHWPSQRLRRGMKDPEDRPIKPRFERAHVIHQHQWNDVIGNPDLEVDRKSTRLNS